MQTRLKIFLLEIKKRVWFGIRVLAVIFLFLFSLALCGGIYIAFAEGVVKFLEFIYGVSGFILFAFFFTLPFVIVLSLIMPLLIFVGFPANSSGGLALLRLRSEEMMATSPKRKKRKKMAKEDKADDRPL